MEDNYSCLKNALENDQTPEVKVKRKFRTSLTVKNKLEVIEYATLHPNATQSKIASHFGIDRTTVSKVLKRRHDIMTYAGKFHNYSDLMNTSLIKKPSSPMKDDSDSSNQRDISETSYDSVINGENGATPDTAQIKANLRKAINKNYPPNSKDNSEFYNPELNSKCESWFMEQNISPNKHKLQHENIAKIRSFSKLLSTIPLSESDCFKILAGKHVKDACLEFIKNAVKETPEFGRTAVSRGYELLHKFLLEVMPELDLDQYYCNGFTAFEADDVKRIWVKYVQPKLQLYSGYSPRASVQDYSYNLPLVIPEQALQSANYVMPESPDAYANELHIADTSNNNVIPLTGSRKRKMNYKPMKMVASENGDVYWGYSNNDGQGGENLKAAHSPNENIAPENLTNKRKRLSPKSNLNEDVLNLKTDYPVIEIKPLNVESEARVKPQGRPSSKDSATAKSVEEMAANSLHGAQFANATQLILAYTKSLEDRINKIEAKGNVKTNQLKGDNHSIELKTAVNDIVNRCQSSLSDAVEMFTRQVNNMNRLDKPVCNCDCAGIKEEVSRLSTKIDLLQENIDKIAAKFTEN